MAGKNNLKQEYGQILRKHMRRHEDSYDLSSEEFVKLRRLVRRKATRELADAAFRAYMAVLNIPTDGSFSGQHIQNLAALSISSKRINNFGWNAQERLEILADETRINREKMTTRNKIVKDLQRKEFKMALGK